MTRDEARAALIARRQREGLPEEAGYAVGRLTRIDIMIGFAKPSAADVGELLRQRIREELARRSGDALL